MNSIVSDDLTRDHLALETAKCLKNISLNSQKVAVLHKELLEINLSVTAYIEESKHRLATLRGRLAHEAKSSQKVVEILSDKYDATLEWFGRTIKTRKKISAFLNHDVQCSRHHFTSVEAIEKIQWRQERQQRTEESILASPLHSPELIRSKVVKRRHSQLRCNSPEWAEGCKPNDTENSHENNKKRLKTHHTELMSVENNFLHKNDDTKNRVSDSNEMNNHGDGVHGKTKYMLVTPPNVEIGQGDCLPSTSGTDSDRSHEALNAQLPKLAVECNGYIEFPKSRGNGIVSPRLKWERKCKVQISYSDDPLNVGEYIIWAVRYHDENKCRRNLLHDFEKVSADEKS